MVTRAPSLLAALLLAALLLAAPARTVLAEPRAPNTVTVPGVLALSITPQPNGDTRFVSNAADAVTQFSLAANYGILGLLAHNYRAGKAFFNLASGQAVRVGYSDGGVQMYRITDVYRFQALDPFNPRSSFVDLDTGAIWSAAELFAQMYTGGDRVVFQTCIERSGNPVWGRLFVVAARVN